MSDIVCYKFRCVDEKPPEWRPSNPPKKMVYADKKSFFGGSNFEYVSDPVPEYQVSVRVFSVYHDLHVHFCGARSSQLCLALSAQAGAKLKKPDDEEEALNPAWVPSGAHSHGHKGTASVCLNPAQLRHQIYAKTAASSARTSRTTTR